MASTSLWARAERSDAEVRGLEGLAPRSGPLVGTLPADVALLEDGLRYSISQSDSRVIVADEDGAASELRDRPLDAARAHADLVRSRALDEEELIDELTGRGIQLPILLRFSDILRARIELICGAFNGAIKEYGYQGQYRGVELFDYDTRSDNTYLNLISFQGDITGHF
mgnify:CR=1 FL=1